MGSTNSTMTSNIESFDKLAKKYYSNPERVKIVEDYEMADWPMILKDGSTVHGTCSEGPKKGIPVFDFIKFPTIEEGGTCILSEKGSRSNQMIKVFIPAGFNKGSICNNMQPYDYNISESGLSSLWHLLAITENVTYCNAVTLKKDQINIVLDKKDLLLKAMKILITGKNTDIGSLKWLRELS